MYEYENTRGKKVIYSCKQRYSGVESSNLIMAGEGVIKKVLALVQNILLWSLILKSLDLYKTRMYVANPG